MSLKIVYFDKVYLEFKNILASVGNNDYKLDIKYFYELNNKEKEIALIEADVFLVASSKITKNHIEKAINLKLIQKTGIGIDNIDIEVAQKHGVPVCNTPGANAVSVSELTIAMILNLYRKLIKLDSTTKSGEWHMWKYRFSSYEMHGKTHGFIGFGNIGIETAKKSKGLGTKIIYYDLFRVDTDIESKLEAKFHSFEEVLQMSDILSIHVPLLPETKHLISNEEFSKMKSNSIIINVSRGNVVDEKALVHALEKGKISGAGIDVWTSEPVNEDNQLLTFDNVIATPHIGAGTRDSLERVLSMAIKNINNLGKGKPLNSIVNSV